MEIDVEEALLNYYNQKEIEYMKEDEQLTHEDLHERLEAMLEYVKPYDNAVRQKYVDESIIREQLSDGRSRRELLCKDCRQSIIFDI